MILHVRVTACVLVASVVLASPAWSLTYDEVEEKTAALMRIGDFPAALETAEEMVLLANQRWGDNHPQTAAAILTLAGIQLKLADYSAAERHYRYALEQLEVAFGAGDPRVADALFGLAELYKFEQRKREAWALYRRADQILRDAGDEWRAEAARVQQKIGGFLLGERENEKAREAFEASHATIEAELGAAHPEIVESLNGEAGIFYSAGQFDEAAALFRKGLAIREAALGADHPEVGWSLNMLGAVLFTQRKYDEAEAVCGVL
ncbi:MAG: tetratricopeptide repeat protein [Brucellaceae bacterium]|nr:tetratricopeptide repeat protein [Brucellaceae bacterium]